MAGLTKIINDAHATDAVTTPYKRLLEELSKAGKDSSNLEDQGCRRVDGETIDVLPK